MCAVNTNREPEGFSGFLRPLQVGRKANTEPSPVTAARPHPAPSRTLLTIAHTLSEVKLAFPRRDVIHHPLRQLKLSVL